CGWIPDSSSSELRLPRSTELRCRTARTYIRVTGENGKMNEGESNNFQVWPSFCCLHSHSGASVETSAKSEV
ncbi:hypothetical protein LEMLEM_LOCUS198, partial [Lemmus lemmus]